MKITFRVFRPDMTEIHAAALAMLREKSPVGQEDDPHPGLYRDSHLTFINGELVEDVSGWKPGDEIEISNPVPYSRKIELGRLHISVPPHVYETTADTLAGRFGNQASIKLAFMPVKFGHVGEWAETASARALAKRIRRGNPAFHTEWLTRQPALIIKEAA